MSRKLRYEKMYRIRKTIYIISILILFITSAQASHVFIDPEHQTVSIGEKFTVDIIVDPEGIEINGAQYDLYFDNILLNATEQITGSFLSHDGASTNIYANKINNSYSDTEGKIEYGEARAGVNYGMVTPGVLATITFEVIAEEESTSELRLDNVKLCDISVLPPPTTTYTNGYISIKEYICGDVDKNGAVNILDVRLLMNHVSHTGYPIDSSAGDVTGDGNVDSDDVQLLVMHVFDNDAYLLQCECNK